MNNKIYVLKQRSFMFNDDNFHCVLGSDYGVISFTCNDKKELIEHWKTLEYQHAHQSSWLQILNNENVVYESKIFQTLMLKHNLQVKNNEQVHQLDNQIYQILKNLTRNELFELIIELDANIFSYVEYDNNVKFYVLWNSVLEDYEINDANIPELEPPQIILVKAESLDMLIENFSIKIIENIPKKIKGSLEQLSETPLLLQAIIENNTCFSYKNKILSIREPAISSLLSINGVLKIPLFEHRLLTLDEVVHIEQQLNMNLGSNEDD